MIKHKYIFAILVIVILVTGCWNSRELSDRSIILAAGFDKVDNERYKLTVEIPKYGQDGGNGKAKTEAWITSDTGESFFDSIRNLPFHTGTKAFWGHTKLLIIGEELAKKGIASIIDYFGRDGETRLDTYIFIAKDSTAEDILKNIKGEIETLGSQQVIKSLKTKSATSKIIEKELLKLYQETISEGVRPTIPGIINASGDKSYEIENTAIFKEDKLVGWLNPTETRGLNWLTDNVNGGLILVNYKNKSKAIILEIIRSSTNTKIEILEDDIFYKPRIDVVVNVGEQMVDLDLSDPIQKKDLEKEIIKEIEKEIFATMKKAKELKADSIGIGNDIYKNNKIIWDQIKDDWEESYFPLIKLDPKIKVEIKQTGLLIKRVKRG